MKQKILFLLRDSKDYVSGEDISKKLNISRTAVWKHIEVLRQEGYVIDSLPRKGYKIVSVPDILYPWEIKKDLDTQVFGREIHHFQSVPSTNNVAKELAEDGAAEGTVIIAEEQTQGRGRMDRTWHSPAGGIWMSVILRPDLPPYRVQDITLVAAVAVVNAIKVSTGLDPMIKWPNDIYMGGRKVCGILTEMKGEADKVHYVVVGIGLNVNNDFAEAENDLQTAGSLKGIAHKQLDRKELVREILSCFEKNFSIYCREGLASILDLWRHNNITLGRNVILKIGDREFSGIAVDITSEGGLLLRDKQGRTKAFYSGEVTVTGHEKI